MRNLTLGLVGLGFLVVAAFGSKNADAASAAAVAALAAVPAATSSVVEVSTRAAWRRKRFALPIYSAHVKTPRSAHVSTRDSSAALKKRKRVPTPRRKAHH